MQAEIICVKRCNLYISSLPQYFQKMSVLQIYASTHLCILEMSTLPHIHVKQIYSRQLCKPSRYKNLYIKVHVQILNNAANIVTKREIVHHEQFLLYINFAKIFSRVVCCRCIKIRLHMGKS